MQRIYWKCVHQPLSQDLAALADGAGFTATGLAPAEAGVDARCGEESTARAGDGRRGLRKQKLFTAKGGELQFLGGALRIVEKYEEEKRRTV